MKRLLITFVLAFVGYVPSAFALLPGESIVFDPVKGEYIVTYLDDQETGTFQQVILIPTNQIDPAVKSSFKLRDGGIIDYRYTVKNGEKSRQPLTGFSLEPVSDIISNIPLPKSGAELEANIDRIPEFFAASKQAIRVPNGNWTILTSAAGTGKGLSISWIYRTSLAVPPGAEKTMSEQQIAALVEAAGLQKGKVQDGFGFSSRDLPGMVMAQLDGNAPMTGYSGEGPDPLISDLSAKLLELEEQTSYVTRPAAVPTVAVPIPFDPAVTLERLQTHMHSWIAMQLLDATFSARLDRYFQSAISAYRLNQPKVGKKHIQTMRELIRKEQPDADKEEERDERDRKDDDHDHHRSAAKRALIDPLAARILDFDLKYVIKRMGGEKDD